MNEMKQKEKEEAAKHVTEVVLSGYEMLHQWANKSIRFSERKMQKLERDGEIDFSVKIPIDARGNLVEAREFINEFNDTNAEILKVSESFKEEVRPVMTRVLAKKGVGMTDEQRLLWLFGKDIGMKATLIYSVMSQRKEILNHLKEYTANNRTASQPSNSYQESHTETHKATVVEPVVVEEFDETHDRAYDGEAYVSNEAPTAKDIVDGMVNPK
jgi:hypothetical protein